MSRQTRYKMGDRKSKHFNLEQIQLEDLIALRDLRNSITMHFNVSDIK